MFATSHDILNWVLAVCAIFITFFLCWAFYYFIASIQNIYKLIKRIENGVSKVEEIIAIAKDKLKNSATYFMILGEIAKKAMEFVAEKRATRQENKTTGRKRE
ncbi:MAG: hypothetical protein WC458_03740 [Patescibacteria group bacterium]|jgi:hypothetical protein